MQDQSPTLPQMQVETPAPIPASNPPSLQSVTPPPQEPSKKHFPLLAVALLILATAAVVLMYVATNLLQYNMQATSTEVAQPTSTQRKLIVGTEATFEPMESLDENGNFVGYDIELGQRLASQMGVEIEFRNIAWDDIFTSLEKGEIDMIISAVTITDERREKYDFSEAYLNAGQVIVTRQSDEGIKTTADLAGKKIAVQKGTTNETQALEFTSSELVLTYDSLVGATEALVAGQADAIFSDLTGAKGIINQNEGLKIASEPFTSDYYGIVFRKDQTELLGRVNEALNALRQQGVLVYLKQKWLE